MKYLRSSELDEKIRDIVCRLNLNYIDVGRVVCIRSFGTKSRRVLARCHTLPKIIQKALSMDAHYVIEIVSENFNRLNPEEQLKVLIHEVLHIPKTFGGGFRHHRPYVNRRTVERAYKMYRSSRNNVLRVGQEVKERFSWMRRYI